MGLEDPARVMKGRTAGKKRKGGVGDHRKSGGEEITLIHAWVMHRDKQISQNWEDGEKDTGACCSRIKLRGSPKPKKRRVYLTTKEKGNSA